MKLLVEIWNNKNILWELARNDCKARFSTTALGATWTFLQPLINILIIWYVFQVGFKSAPVENVPFIVWYLPAFFSWNFFSEALGYATNSILEYSYLVKKVNFKVSIIPVIKIVSASFIHLGFIGFIIIVNFIYGEYVSIFTLQVIYYFFCTLALLIGLGWLSASISTFLNDFANVISIIIQTGFWATPIFWDPSNMSPLVQFVLKLNPMFYICQGYRDSFIYKVGFWQHPWITLYFWIIVIILFVLGSRSFNKVRPFLDDIL